MANRNEVRFVVGAASDVGKVREVNEDAHGFARSAAGDLILVCDGMGGHAGGQVASQTARDAILGHVTSAGRLEAGATLRSAIQEAHRKVRELAGANAELHGMGTTCVAALVRGNRATVANVGDSRCYVVAGGGVRQISKDHTKAQQLLDQGLIAPEQFANHPQKGVLAMALGQTQVPEPAIAEVELGVGDYLVLCSDGAYDCLSLAELGELTAGLNPNLAADRMVEVAVERDGKDNATVVIGRSVDFTVRAAVVAPVLAEPVAVVEPKWRQVARTWGPSIGGALIGALATVGVYAVTCHGPAEKGAVVPASGAATGEAPDAGAGDLAEVAGQPVVVPAVPKDEKEDKGDKADKQDKGENADKADKADKDEKRDKKDKKADKKEEGGGRPAPPAKAMPANGGGTAAVVKPEEAATPAAKPAVAGAGADKDKAGAPKPASAVPVPVNDPPAELKK